MYANMPNAETFTSRDPDLYVAYICVVIINCSRPYRRTRYHYASRVLAGDVNKARTLKAKAKAKHYQGQGHSPKAKAKAEAKAIPVGSEAGTVPSRTAMGDHGK